MKKFFLILILAVIAPMLAKADMGPFRGIITMGAPNVTQTGATFTGVATLISGDPVLSQKGFVWSTLPNPSVETNQGSQTLGVGSSAGPTVEVFTYTPTLAANTTYHVKAFVTNTDGTFYSDEVTFTTIPTLGEWGLIAFGSLVAVIGGVVVWRRVRIA